MMTLVLHTIILFLVFMGCAACYQGGSFTRDNSKRIIGSIILITALVFVISLYGEMRGLFTYIGLLSLIGMVFTLLRRT